jgi:hypothetical protein
VVGDGGQRAADGVSVHGRGLSGGVRECRPRWLQMRAQKRGR